MRRSFFRRKSIMQILVLITAFGVLALPGCSRIAKIQPPVPAETSAEEQSEKIGDNGKKGGSTEEILNEFAGQDSYLYGRTFSGYVLKEPENEDVMPEYDVSEVPVQKLAYSVLDFDRDGEPELLKIGLNQNYTLKLSMYECEDGQAILSDEKNLPEELSIVSALSDSDSEPGVVDCCLFGEERSLIGIERSDLESLRADGTDLQFVALAYENDAFTVENELSYKGSDGERNDKFMSGLEELGIHVSWDELFARQSHVFDYVDRYQDLMRMTTAYLCTHNEFSDWQEDETERLRCTEITFSSREELERNTRLPTPETEEQAEGNEESEGADWSADSGGEGYILPDSDKRYLAEEELSGLSAEELRLARNEIYARHGRIFQNEFLNNHFSACDWYRPTKTASEFSESVFNQYERANRNLIVAYEKKQRS